MEDASVVEGWLSSGLSSVEDCSAGLSEVDDESDCAAGAVVLGAGTAVERCEAAGDFLGCKTNL